MNFISMYTRVICMDYTIPCVHWINMSQNWLCTSPYVCIRSIMYDIIFCVYFDTLTVINNSNKRQNSYHVFLFINIYFSSNLEMEYRSYTLYLNDCLVDPGCHLSNHCCRSPTLRSHGTCCIPLSFKFL